MAERLTLDSDKTKWIDLKPVYTMGDKEDVHGYSNIGLSDGGNTYQLNPVKYRTAQCAARILNWNLAREALKKNKDTGKLEVVEDVIPWDAQAPFSRRIATLRSLDERVVEEVYDAIRARDLAREAATAAAEAEAQEKNDETTGEPDSDSNSPSAS